MLTIDFQRHSVSIHGQEVALTVLEYNLLTNLVSRAGQVLSQKILLEQVWGPEYDECGYVKWHISRLRRKIEDDPNEPKLVVTIRGVGYRYEMPEEETTGNGHRTTRNGAATKSARPRRNGHHSSDALLQKVT